MISLADKLIACGNSRSVELSRIVAYSDTLPTGFTTLDSSNGVVAMSGAYDDTLDSLIVLSTGETGAINWQRKVSGSALLSASGVQVDSAGNVYVFCNLSTTSAVAVLLKYNASGALQWQRQISKSATNVITKAMMLSTDGYIYLMAGHTVGATYSGYTLLKYNSSGALQWQSQCSYVSGHIYATGIAEGPDGNIYLACYRTGIMTRKYNPAGAFLAYAAITASTAAAHGIDIDTSGNIYIAASVNTNTQAALVKTNSSFAVQWAKQFDTTLVRFSGIKILASGNIAYSTTQGLGSYGEFTSAGALAKQRTLTVSSLASTISGLAESSDAKLLFAGSGKINGTKYEALLGAMNASADTGTYGTVNSVSETTYTISDATYSTFSEVWTEAAGALTDAAGSLTDSAGLLTATNYIKD